MAALLQLTEPRPLLAIQHDCVEIYVPKKIKHLSKLYRFLAAKVRAKVLERFGEIILEGFSIYEVDGVFRGKKLWEERTLVIRLLFPSAADQMGLSVQAKINDLGREIAAKIAATEEQIWICHYAQSVTIIHPHLPIVI